MKLLLVSNSSNHGEGYLDHCIAQMDDFLGPVRRLVFVPFALKDQEAYGAKARARFAAIGVEVATLSAGLAGHAGRHQLTAAEAVFVGGGNTFRLLKILQDSELFPLLRDRVLAGMPYLGASAGVNLACPTIRTTNDMPIVEPSSLDAMGLVPFQVNPHYLDPNPASTHMGETREERIREFHEENDTLVVGLREGGWIRVEDGSACLGGLRAARIFRRGREPEERPVGADLSDLI